MESIILETLDSNHLTLLNVQGPSIILLKFYLPPSVTLSMILASDREPILRLK